MLTIKYAQSDGLIFWKQIFVLIYNFIVLGNNLILFESRLVYLTSINMVWNQTCCLLKNIKYYYLYKVKFFV